MIVLLNLIVTTGQKNQRGAKAMAKASSSNYFKGSVFSYKSMFRYPFYNYFLNIAALLYGFFGYRLFCIYLYIGLDAFQLLAHVDHRVYPTYVLDKVIVVGHE